MSLTTYKTVEATSARLTNLGKFIAKYAHRWNENPSQRLSDWVQEYNQLRSEMSWEQWQDYCESVGYSPSHDAYDCLA